MGLEQFVESFTERAEQGDGVLAACGRQGVVQGLGGVPQTSSVLGEQFCALGGTAMAVIRASRGVFLAFQ